jgi:hypothetical protein
MLVCASLDQLCRNSNLISGTRYRTFHHCIDAQGACDLCERLSRPSQKLRLLSRWNLDELESKLGGFRLEVFDL